MDETDDKAKAKQTQSEIAWGVQSQREHRWPASVAILVAMGIYVALPAHYTIGPQWLIPALELSILVPLSLTSPYRVAHEGRLQQVVASVLIAIVALANVGALILLVERLLHHSPNVTGTELFYSAVSIWMTNVIVFALWYWEIDRGGPDQRVHAERTAPDFLFPQMSTPGCSRDTWTPTFFDYLYVAFTNSTAFSPTDAMPLTHSAKLLMLTQSSISLITVTLVAARAVNILH